MKKSRAADEVEGLGNVIAPSWGEYSVDTALIRSENRTVHDILRRIENKFFVMAPDFQRGFVWPENKQSKLIESVIMRIPLPVLYLAEDDEGRLVVVDGLQRLSTFQNFVNNKLRLKLPGQRDLDGKRFVDLPPKLQNRIEDCNLILYIIDSKVPEGMRLDIFERVNGGIPLTRQQMRNCLLMGPATNFLRSEADHEFFKTATGNSLDTKSMRDREFVNRFCAFHFFGPEAYKGDMDEFLGQSLRLMNSLPPSDLDKLSIEFRMSLKNNFKVFGVHAFRKHTSVNDSRNVINASLWDVMSTKFARYSEEYVQAHTEEIRQAFFRLMENENFSKSITLGTSQLNRVQDRFRIAEKTFTEVLGVNPY